MTVSKFARWGTMELLFGFRMRPLEKPWLPQAHWSTRRCNWHVSFRLRRLKRGQFCCCPFQTRGDFHRHLRLQDASIGLHVCFIFHSNVQVNNTVCSSKRFKQFRFLWQGWSRCTRWRCFTMLIASWYRNWCSVGKPNNDSCCRNAYVACREQVLRASLEAASNQQRKHPQTRMVSMTDPEDLRFEPLLWL